MTLGGALKPGLMVARALVLLAALLAPGIPQAAHGAVNLVVDGPPGWSVPGGRIVPRGSVFNVSYEITSPGLYQVEAGGFSGGEYHGQPISGHVVIDTGAYSDVGHAAVTSVPIRISVYQEGYTDGPYPNYRVVTSETLWILNPVPTFKHAIQILNGGDIREGDEIRYRVNLTPEILSAGRGPDEPYAADRFWVYLARLGGTLPNGLPMVEREQSIALHLASGTQDLAYPALPPGLYELRLRMGEGGLTYGATRFQVKADAPRFIALPADARGRSMELGITRQLVLPDVRRIRQGDPMPVEVNWVKEDPDSPDLADFLQRQRVTIARAGASFASCVSGTFDISQNGRKSYVMERLGPGRFVLDVDTTRLTVGRYYVFAEGINEEELRTPEAPLESIASFEILPPQSGGLLAYARERVGPGPEDFRYAVSLQQPLPRGIDRARVGFVHPPLKTAGGATLPVRTGSFREIRTGETVTIPDSPVGMTSDLVLTADFRCGEGTCEDVILDSLPVAPAAPWPEAVVAAIRADPGRFAVTQTWPGVDRGPPSICSVQEKIAPDYSPPPFLALEAGVFPRVSVPGLASTVAFRVSNPSGLDAAQVRAEIQLVDPGLEREPNGLSAQTESCTPTGPGSFSCYLGDMAPDSIADVVFHADTPMSGQLLWLVKLESAGDLGGMTDRAGVLGQQAPPDIVDVVVIDDQTRVRDGVPSYPYPFQPGRTASQSRYLLVVGHNLRKPDAEKVNVPDADTLDYNFLAYDDTGNAFYRDWIDKGWRRYFEVNDTAAARAKAKDEGLEALLVRADLKRGVLPGRKHLAVNDAEGYWPLKFGDLTARFSFIRLRGDSGFEPLEEAYLPERIYLAIETSISLPLTEIPVFLDTSAFNADADIPLTAHKSSALGDGRLFIAGPIDIRRTGGAAGGPGGTAITVTPNADNPPLLQAHVDETFIRRDLRLPFNPPIASVALRLTPAEGEFTWLWYDALNRAAACTDAVAVQDWSLLGQSEADNIWNIILVTKGKHLRNQTVRFGHAAAAILLRDMFLKKTRAGLAHLEWMLDNRKALDGFVAYLHENAFARDVPTLDMEVEDFDGSDIAYRYVIADDVAWLAEAHHATPEAIRDWQLRATRNAVTQLIEAVRKSLTNAEGAGDCKFEKLFDLTGFGFEPVARSLKPKLMRLHEVGLATKRQIWTPDSDARRWVDAVAPLAEAIRSQQAAAGVDNDLILTGLGIITLPLGFAESATVSILSFALDIANLSLTTAQELSQYFASRSEIAFALGASITIGDSRYRQAQEQAKGWASTTLGIGSALFGAVVSGLDAVPRIVVLARAARGRLIAQALKDASEIGTLARIDLRDFGTFAMASWMRRQELGLDALNAIERRSINMMEDFGRSHATRPLPEPDLPPERLVESFVPSERMRFDPEEAYAGVRPVPGRSIERPSTGGDIPNAPEARIPDEAVIRFYDADGVPREFRLGERLGGGYTSEAFADAVDPDAFVVRVTYLAEGAPAAALDRFGNAELRAMASSENVRAARIVQDYAVAGGTRDGRVISRVTIMERVEPAEVALARQPGGRMTIAQMMALDGTLNELNARGLVWLDNKWDNFGFVPLNDGSGRVQVVIFDTGGIFKIKAGAGGAMGLSEAEIARKIQLVVNGDFATNLPNHAWIRTPQHRQTIREQVIRHNYGEAFAYEEMGLPPMAEGGLEQLLFNARSGNDFDYFAPIFEAVH